jgi:hypothetical protein
VRPASIPGGLTGKAERLTGVEGVSSRVSAADRAAGLTPVAITALPDLSGDTMRLTLAAFAAMLAIAPACAQTYTYVPTERDRAELRACERSAGPTTKAEDCLLPVVTRVAAGMRTPPGQDWPDDPQMAALMRIGLTACGLPPGVSPHNVPTPPPKQCLQAEANKINAVVVSALRDVLFASGEWK